MKVKTEYGIQHLDGNDWVLEIGPIEDRQRAIRALEYNLHAYVGHNYRLVSRQVSEWMPVEDVYWKETSSTPTIGRGYGGV